MAHPVHVKKGTPDPSAKRPRVKLPKKNERGRVPKPDQEIVDKLVAYHQRRKGHIICGAWCGGKGDVCTNFPKRGYNRCRMHGGNSLRGIESPSLRTGLFSKVLLDTPYAESYARLTHDKRLMDLGEHIGFATSVLEEMMAEMFTGSPPAETWSRIARLCAKIRKAGIGSESAAPMLEEMMDLLDEGGNKAALRAEIRKQQDHIRKLNTTERRHLEKERELMSVEAYHVNMRIMIEGMKLHFQEADIMRYRGWLVKNIMGIASAKTLTPESQN